MEYVVVVALLFILLMAYFRMAQHWGIVDVPNHRSQHSEITLRGGGIVYPLAFFIFFGFILVLKKENLAIQLNSYLIFGAGLISICTISFIDDILDLSSKVRLLFHFIAVSLLFYFWGSYQVLPLWGIPLLYILVIGILNAYNFMDGINGMSALYSLISLCTLLYINEKMSVFTDNDFILHPLLASVVFLFFNFRKKARCFMGDVGSMGIAFWIIALLGLIIAETGNWKWLLLLSVYGIETVLTIVERLKLKENIFDAHRKHLYQLFANEKKVDHRLISIAYGLLQLIINVIVINSDFSSFLLALLILIPAAVLYLLIKNSVKKSLL